MKFAISRLVVLVSLLFMGLSNLAAAQSAELKIGYIDLQRIIDSSAEGQRARDEIQQKAKELEQQAKQMEESLKTQKADFDNQSDALTPEARSEKRDELAKLERDLSRFVKDSQAELRLTEQRSLKQLLENVGKLVVEYGKQNNFTIIVEASNILYGADSINITDDVIQAYNAGKK